MKRIGTAFQILCLLAAIGLATDLLYTWAGTEWNSGWSSGVESGVCDTTTACAYDTGNGNPTYCFTCTCKGKNDSGAPYWQWAGTWETLGVTPGNVVSTIRLTDVDTKALTWTNCTTMTIGPLTLRDSGGALVATMWAGRSPTAAEGSWTAEGSDPAQSVGSLMASSASIRLRFLGQFKIANTSNSQCTSAVDNLDITIVHALPSGAKRKLVITFKGGPNGLEPSE